MSVLSPEQAAAAMRGLSKDVVKVIAKEMNGARKRATAQARRDFRSQNPGRSIFRFKGGRGTPPLKISGRAARLSQSQGAFVTQLIIKGMAALIEQGGKTKPPRGGVIRPVRAKALRFHGRGGVVFAAEVNHRGSRVPKNEIGRRAIEKEFRLLPGFIDAALAASTRANGLA